MASFWETIYGEVVIKVLIVGVICGVAVTYLNENLSVLRTALLIASARRKLASGRPRKVLRGVHMLTDVARTRPTRRQEMVDIIVEDCFRRHFDRQKVGTVPTSPAKIEVFVGALKVLLSLPRKDENGHPLNIDLHQISLVSSSQSIYLERMNFSDVVLWGSEFVHIDLSRSDFEDADLGGVRFFDCGLEDLNLRNARMCHSPIDGRPTVLERCAAARSNIDEALILDASAPQLLIDHCEIEGRRVEALRAKGQAVSVA